MYTMIQGNRKNEAEIYYSAPCGEAVHIATVYDRGTNDERLVFDSVMNGKPVSSKMLKNVVMVLEG